MKKLTTFLPWTMVLLLSISLTLAQSPVKNNHLLEEKGISGVTASPADRSPEPGNPDLPPSDALYDLVWKVNTHGYPTAYNEAGIETDGTYIYSTRWNTNGAFFRYTMAGVFVDGFSIGGAGAIRDLAYDPAVNRMYGGAGATTLYEMNFNTFTLVSSVVAPTAVRAIAWDPDLNIFYANNWSTAITKFTKAGVSQGSFACGPAGSSYYGFAYCPVGTCGGPLLYGYAQTGVSPYNYLVEMALPSGTETGNNLDISTLIGATSGTAGGLAFYKELAANKWVVLGLSQNEWIWTAEVCQEPENDVGVISVNSPVSGWNLGVAETVEVTVKNFGTLSQSNIPLCFTLDGGAQQWGVLAGPLPSGLQADYTFSQTIDLSSPGQTYNLVCCTFLPGDMDPSNDCQAVAVQNQVGIYCDAGATTCDEYIDNVQLATLFNPSGCGLGSGGVTGYSDYTAMTTTLLPGISYTLSVHNPVPYNGDQCVAWIDWTYNGWDDGDSTVLTTPDYYTFTGTIIVPANAVYGPARLRIRLSYTGAMEPCGITTYGEVEDYTVFLQTNQDVGITSILSPVTGVNLSSQEAVSVRIKNFGVSSQANIPVRYRINGSAWTEELFAGPVPAGDSTVYTFAQKADLSAYGEYALEACTNLAGDPHPENDCRSGLIYNYLTANLVAYYPFNANANDESGFGNHGTPTGATLTSDRFGVPNKAYFFDGINDYINVPHDPSLNLEEGFTFTAWINSSSTEGPRIILGKSGGYGTSGYILKDHNNSDKIRIELFNFADLTGSASIPVGEWIFVAATYDRNELKLYHNALPDNTMAATEAVTANTLNLSIGACQGFECFYGKIDDIRIYNQALSLEELQYLYYPIVTQPLAGTGFCQQGAVSVNFVTTVTFQAGNIFIAELSDANGSFASPVIVGTLTATTSGTISATIPVNTPVGQHYRIRVTATNPPAVGSDNGQDIGISSPVQNNLIGDDQTIVTGTVPQPLTGTLPTGGNGISFLYQWQSSTTGPVSGYTNIPGATSIQYSPPALTQTTWYRRRIISGYCGVSLSNVVKIEVVPMITLNIKAFLEGPFLTSQMMPYLNIFGFLPTAQPYNLPPWNYNGSESVATIPNAEVVDWVLVELRETTGGASTATSGTMIGRQAGFILKNGSIVGTSGSSNLEFGLIVNHNLYLVIWHRNHLAIMSSVPLAAVGGVYTYDFTTGVGQAYGGILGQKQLAAGTWGMISGDGDGNRNINNADKNDIWKPQSGSSGYLNGDFNMNGNVDNIDKNDHWRPNSGKGSQVPL
jgi:hypothetical protein